MLLKQRSIAHKQNGVTSFHRNYILICRKQTYHCTISSESEIIMTKSSRF